MIKFDEDTDDAPASTGSSFLVAVAAGVVAILAVRGLEAATTSTSPPTVVINEGESS